MIHHLQDFVNVKVGVKKFEVHKTGLVELS